MQELEQILKDHAARYPEMQAVDDLKLVYQNEFGGGHLVQNGEETRENILREQEAAAPVEVPVEPIGNGLCRLHLGSTRPQEAGVIARLFAAASAEVTGSSAGFVKKLALLRALCEEGALPLDAAQLDAALADYPLDRHPPFSHSDAFRAAYAPHYRVLRLADARALAAFAVAEQVAQTGGLLAIDGRCASGKSTLAARIGAVYGCPVFHMDDYFLPAELRTAERFAEPGGNVHRERVEEEILRPFSEGRPVVYRPFDCHSMTLKAPVTVPAAPFAVVEGCYAMHPALRGYFAGAVFLTHSPQAQRRRILARSGEKMLARFEQEWIPLEERYFSGCAVPQACGVQLDTTDLF